MVDIRLKYQVSIFCDMSDVKPTPDNIKALIDIFGEKGLVPASFYHIDSPSAPQLRLGFSSPNGEWTVRLPAHRVDIEKHASEPHGENLGTLDEFCKEAESFLAKLISRFRKKANRMSLVTDFLLKEMDESQLAEVYSKFFRCPKFYVERQPFEWDWRSAAKDPLKLNDLSETLNVITTVKRLKGELQNAGELALLDRVQLSFDINISPENNEYRFDFQHISSFYNEILKLHENLFKEMEDFISERTD